MKEIFLSASVPVLSRGNYYETANPFLIQCAVRELIIAVISKYKIVWGGHPAITPMIWAICEDLGADYASSVVLYQSAIFEDRFPEENKKFSNVIFTDNINNNQHESLSLMRTHMLSREDIVAGVFIGGMEGIKIEYEMFKELHPKAEVLLIAAPGGAALQLAKSLNPEMELDIDFARIFYDLSKNLDEKYGNHDSPKQNR